MLFKPTRTEQTNSGLPDAARVARDHKKTLTQATDTGATTLQHVSTAQDSQFFASYWRRSQPTLSRELVWQRTWDWRPASGYPVHERRCVLCLSAHSFAF